jgi:N-acyl-D-amino-acid deacylase
MPSVARMWLRMCGAILLSCLCTLSSHGAAVPEPPAAAATVIINAQVADGTGSPLRTANVRVVADRIVKIGDFQPERGERVIDASRQVLAPGFIDIHNHSDVDLPRQPLAESQIAQGITTVVLGPDGFSAWPVGSWLGERRKNPASLNLALLVGHATVRELVMKKDYRRSATASEVDEMVKLVDQAMHEGAIGLSSGLEYEVASYSNTDEVVALASAAARDGGFYMTHVRDEADKSFEALEEEIAIAERARIRVEHSHIKLGTVKVWNQAPRYIRIIEAARRRGVDFLADCYPYDTWNSTIKVLVPDQKWDDPRSVDRALADVGGASHVTISDFPPDRSYEHRTIEQLARAHGVSSTDMYIRIVRQGDAAGIEAEVLGRSMTEADMAAFYRQPWVMVASDGGLGSAHPRGAGTFPRVLGLLVREKHWLTLAEAIHKMTALPASRLGWKDRGVVREGAFADLVLFNPDVIGDRATFEHPQVLPVGIAAVFVNGEIVWRDGKPTGARPGRVLPE